MPPPITDVSCFMLKQSPLAGADWIMICTLCSLTAIMSPPSTEPCSGQAVWRLDAKGPINCLGNSPSGDFIVLTSCDVFKIVDARDLTKLRVRTDLRPPLLKQVDCELLRIWDAAWNPTVAATLATSGTSEVAIWDLCARQLRARLGTDNQCVHKLCWVPGEPELLLAGGKDGVIRLWDLRAPARPRGPDFCGAHARQHRIAVRDVACNARREHQFAAGYGSGEVAVWDRRSARGAVLQCHRSAATSVAWHPVHGELLASGGADRCCRVWNVDDPQAARFKVETIADEISVVKWRPGGPDGGQVCQLATAAPSYDLLVRVWDVFRPHTPIYSVGGHVQAVTDVAWHRRQHATLLTVSRDGFLQATTLGRPHICNEPGACLSWSPGGTLAAVCEPVDRGGYPPNASQLDLQRRIAEAPRDEAPPVQSVMMMICDGADDAAAAEQPPDPFETLAQTYRLRAGRHETTAAVCRHNATAAELVRNAELAGLWALLELWCEDPPPPPAARRSSLSGSGAGSAGSVDSCPTSPTPDSGTPTWGSPKAGEYAGDAAALSPAAPLEADPPMDGAQPPAPLQLAVGPEGATLPAPSSLGQVVRDVLEEYCERGDVQTCCTVLTVLGDLLGEGEVDSDLATALFLAYIDLLQIRQLFVAACALIKYSPRAVVPKIAGLTQTGTSVGVGCGSCPGDDHGARVGIERGQSRCGQCYQEAYVCAVCHTEVRGVVVWNRDCGHGGHAECLRRWHAKHRQCPECGMDADV